MMSHGPGQFPQTVAACHKLILDLHAELDQRELRVARLRSEIAARRARSVDGTQADCTNQSLSRNAVSNESNRHNRC